MKHSVGPLAPVVVACACMLGVGMVMTQAAREFPTKEVVMAPASAFKSMLDTFSRQIAWTLSWLYIEVTFSGKPHLDLNHHNQGHMAVPACSNWGEQDQPDTSPNLPCRLC